MDKKDNKSSKKQKKEENLKNINNEENFEKIKEYINGSIKNTKDEMSKLIDEKYNLLIDTIKNNMEKTIEENKDLKESIEKNYKTQFKKSDNGFQNIKKSINSLLNHKNEEKIYSELNSIKDEVNKLSKDLKEISEEIKNDTYYIESINDVIKRVKQQQEELSETIQLLQGKMKSLDKIEELKQDIQKNINKKEVVVSNLDEDILNNLGKYGNKIIDELTIAARCYAKNKEKLEIIDKEKNEYENKIIDTQKEYKEKGKEKGKLSIVEEIIDKCDGVDKLYDSEDGFEKIIKDILRNNGFMRDENFKIGDKISVTEENKNQIQEKFHCEEVGTYKVKKSVILLNDKVHIRGELEKIELKNIENSKKEDLKVKKELVKK